MRTVIISLDKPDRYGPSLRDAAEALRAGALVVFPTETVYGVGANAAHTEAMRRLREVKGRASQQGFTVHIPHRADAARYVADASPVARRLARKAWPGPLTLVCRVESPEDQEIGKTISPSQLGDIYYENKVGLRCPAHAAVTELLVEAGVPVLASSANRAGNQPPLDLRAAMRDLENQVEFAIDGGRTRHNTSSTVVEIEGPEWEILREGVIDRRTLERMVRTEIVMVCTGNSCRSPIAEYLFRHELARRLGLPVGELAKYGYFVSSAGMAAAEGGPISEFSQKELARHGIDAAAHRARPLTVELIQHSERIFAMSYEHRRAVIDMAPSAADRVFLLDDMGPVADPIGGGAPEYHNCAMHIERAVNARLEEFVNEDLSW
jgi:tRNA threonylcarbamoyl adenosine modification protein (Sua5/YciO/YrdC/YwlC family)